MKRRIRTCFCIAVVLAFMSVPPARAILGSDLSVAEAIHLATSWISYHPARAEGYFFLGRATGWAWAKGSSGKGTEIFVTNPLIDGLPSFGPFEGLMLTRDPKLAVTPESLGYLTDTITAFRDAANLDENNPRYELALGWSLEQAAAVCLMPTGEITDHRKLEVDDQKRFDAAMEMLGKNDPAGIATATQSLSALMPRCADLLETLKTKHPEMADRIGEVVRAYWLSAAVDHYRTAFQKSVDDDLKSPTYDLVYDKTVSLEAGERLLALMKLRGDDAVNSDEFKKIQQSIDIIKKKPGVSHAY